MARGGPPSRRNGGVNGRTGLPDRVTTARAGLATAVRMQGGGQSPQQGRNAPGTDPACPPLPPSGAKTEIRPLTTRSRHLLSHDSGIITGAVIDYDQQIIGAVPE